jgi:cytochrome c
MAYLEQLLFKPKKKLHRGAELTTKKDLIMKNLFKETNQLSLCVCHSTTFDVISNIGQKGES